MSALLPYFADMTVGQDCDFEDESAVDVHLAGDLGVTWPGLDEEGAVKIRCGTELRGEQDEACPKDAPAVRSCRSDGLGLYRCGGLHGSPCTGRTSIRRGGG